MNGDEQQQAAGSSQRCLCREALDWVTELSGLASPEAQQHFRNSRIEFLKGIRAVLDARIERLSRTTEAGASIQVE